jgi:hypothetical protein
MAHQVDPCSVLRALILRRLLLSFLAIALLLAVTMHSARALPTLRFAIDQDYSPQSQSVNRVTQDFPLVHALHIHILRTGIGWDDTNPRRDAFRWNFWSAVVTRAARDGIAIKPYYAYTPAWAGDAYNSPPRSAKEFARACSVMAGKLGGQVGSFEIWNEPDNDNFWAGTSQRFGDNFAECAGAVQDARPNAKVVLGGLVYLNSTWYARMGAKAARSVNVAAFHEYTETPWDLTTVERDNSNAYFDGGYDGLSHGGRRDVWMNEGGASTAAKQGYSEQSQASWIRRTVASLISHPGRPISLIGFYQLRDPAPGTDIIGNPQAKIFFRHTGLFRSDGRPKLAAATTADLVALLDGQRPQIEPGVSYRAVHGVTSSLFRLHAWRLEDGRRVVCIWDRDNSSSGSVTLKEKGRSAFLHKPDGAILRVTLQNGNSWKIRALKAGAIPLLYEIR